jgi:predicted AAA+ superfamily ATPase
VLKRTHALEAVRRALRRSPVVALLGPRQCGKTTLARELVAADSLHYFDLEDPRSLQRLAEPMTSLGELRGTVVIDEVQRRPDLFPVLRVLADRRPKRARFLVLGSAAPELLQQASESLAGRIEVITLGGFTLDEVGAAISNRHWLRGGFPRSFLARSEVDSASWRAQMIQAFLERDVPQLGFRVPALTLRRFWTMVAHYHGGVWNNAEPARSLGVSEPAVRRYLDLLTGLFMVRQLQPWHENLAKRQVKSPKVYVRDSGLLHELLGIRTAAELLAHPKSGASFEGYAIEQALHVFRPDEAYFWATHQGAELDLLMFKDGRRIGLEVKRQDAPSMTASMRVALDDLRLDRLFVLYPGDQPYELAERVEVMPLAALATADSRSIMRRKRRSTAGGGAAPRFRPKAAK